MKKVLIFSGLPGSGKSYHAINYWDTEEGKNKEPYRIVSADHTMMENGVYNFRPNLLPLAHKNCKKEFVELCGREDCSTIIVDNTNTTALEIAFYYEYAVLMDFDVKIIRFVVDPMISFQRNTHNVPLTTIVAMHDRMEKDVLPKYWNVKIVVCPKENLLI